VTLILLLVLGSGGAAASAWGLNRGGRAAQGGAIVGGVALLGIVALAFALDAPRVGSGSIPAGVGLLDGRLIPNDYLRFTIALWALDAALVVFVAWLAGGLAALRGLLPALLASIVGGTVALAATNLAIGAAAAGATGFVALVVLLAWRDPATLPAAARELRATILSTAFVLGAITLAPLAAGLAIRAAQGGSAGDSGGGSAVAAGAADPAGAAAGVGALVLAIALAVAVRSGVIPFHLRVPRLSDVAPPISMPLLLAWVPLPLAVVGLAVVDLLLAPLALPLGGEQLVIVAVAIVTLVAASIAAFLQDDLRHAMGYLVISDAALVLLGFAALTPEAWGPARTWLLVLAATKTALVAWSAVVEDRFGTRRIPDLRGWGRRSPLLATALLVTTIATYGFPGWAAFESRVQLGQLTGGAPLDVVLLALGFLTLPTYLRLLGVGTGSPTSRVERAAPERIMRTRRFETLPVELERTADSADADGAPAPSRSEAHPGPARRAARRSKRMASKGAAHAGRRLMTALRRDATELTAAAVLTLAVLAALTSWGVLDISGAASEPAPIVSNAASD
jgi:formate hydrogenlyase subunit 3/multisubunit Na+/H+ antiporter MnhD subunit